MTAMWATNRWRTAVRYELKKDADVLLNRAKLFLPATFTQNYYDHYDEFRSGDYCP